MRYVTRSKLFLFALIIGIGITFFPPPVSAKKPIKFWISNLEGKRFDSRKHKGPIVLSFFFVNCPPCIEEMPRLHKLITSNYNNVALLFVDPLEDDDAESIKGFVKGLGVPMEFIYHDSLGRLGKKFYKGTMYFPTIFGIKNGKIVFKITELNQKAVEEIKKAFK